CSRWNELEIVNYCQNELASSERALLETHLHNCTECRERFLHFLDTYLSNPTAQDKQADLDLINSPQWQRWKQQLARKQVKQLKKSTDRGRAEIKAAAMLMVAVLPLVLAYCFIYRPLRESRQPVSRGVQIEQSLSAAAESYENADARLKENSTDKEAILNRAMSEEQLLLLEEASQDYSRYAELESESAKREKGQKRATEIAGELKDSEVKATS